MKEPYEELIEGELYFRYGPSETHEMVCARLYEQINLAIKAESAVRLLPIRSEVKYDSKTILRPDITLVTKAGSKIWLIAEIIDADDHHTDTVVKKSLYEEKKLPRLWMVDIRYQNVEIYHQTAYGFALQRMYINKEVLTDVALPGFELPVYKLFEKEV